MNRSGLIQSIKEAIVKRTKIKSVLLVDFIVKGDLVDNQYYFYESSTIEAGYHLGIYRIFSFLERYSTPVKIVRYNDYKNRLIELDNLVIKADIIGVNSLSAAAPDSFDFCIYIKKKYPDKIIIGGAEHYALDYDWILSNTEITGCDLCCISQGELPLLALSLGMNPAHVGSIAYLSDNKIVKNAFYPFLNDNSEEELLRPSPVTSITQNDCSLLFPEFRSLFQYTGLTQTASGCLYSCHFCTNHLFMGNNINKTFKVATEEIMHLANNNVNFIFFTNPLLNSSIAGINAFLTFIENIQAQRRIYWACFYSIRMNKEFQQFERMAKNGCLMINVGIEDFIGERSSLKRGANNSEVIVFTENAKKYLVIRCLLIMGLPNHYFLKRDELKYQYLSYMKKYPQAIFRINHFTPIFGTSDFDKYQNCFFVNSRDNNSLRFFDTMHPLLDPIKMYEYLHVPYKSRWLKDPDDWLQLTKEIMVEYLRSEQHNTFLDSLKDKHHLYEIANNYRELMINFQEF